MSSFTHFLGGAAAGAGLMFFFDPNQGNRRRALLRDQAYKYYHRGSEQLEGKAEDLYLLGIFSCLDAILGRYHAISLTG